MNISLRDFYEYVFEDRAQIHMGNQVPDALKEKKKQEKVTAIQKKFDFISSSSQDKKMFRHILREAKSSDLETALYENDVNELGAIPDHHYLFPTDDQITTQFKILDAEYGGYFAKEEKAEDAYKILFKSCKLIADYAERNNSHDNGVAYLHAYKLFVLFGIGFTNADAFIKQYNFSSLDKPVHDLLVRDIPRYDPSLDINAWRAWIKKSGPKAIDYFQQAPAIQKILGQVPKDLSEAEDAVSKLYYKRFAEHPELAKLCIQYHISEEAFEKCLEIKPKPNDNLPTIQIDGAALNQPGYHLVKLPIDDPRAYLLGHITNCCQSIGGDSEQCVIDGITRANNGFYVLLKSTHKNIQATPPIVNDKIDYQHYEIVGQGYAWLSKKGNLTFDSWENRTPSVEDAVITKILPVFAKAVTEEKGSDILRVMIGTGGKTPEKLARNLVGYPEEIAEGYQYGDSESQALIYYNKDRVNQHIKKFQEVSLNNSLFYRDITKEEINLLFSRVSSVQKILEIENLFLNKEYSGFWKEVIYDDKSFAKLMNVTKKDRSNFFNTLFLLAQTNMLNSQNYLLLLTHTEYVYGIAQALSVLNKTSPILINDNNFKLLADHAEHASDMACVLAINPILVNDNNFKLLATHAEYAEYLAKASSTLNQINSKLVNDDNFKLLATHVKYAAGDFPAALVQMDSIAKALSILNNINPKLVNDDNFKLLATHAEYAEYLAKALSTLNKINPILVNDNNFKLLTTHAKHANHLADALSTLNQTNQELVNDENLKLLLTRGEQVRDTAWALCELYSSDPKFANNPSIMLQLKNAINAQNIWELTNIVPKLKTQIEQEQEALTVNWRRSTLLSLDEWERQGYLGMFDSRSTALCQIDKTLTEYIDLRQRITNIPQGPTFRAYQERCLHLLEELKDLTSKQLQYGMHAHTKIGKAVAWLSEQVSRDEAQLLSPLNKTPKKTL